MGQQKLVRKHDRPRRLLFTHRRMVEDLLKGFVEGSWVDDLDFSTLKKLGSDFLRAVSGAFEERIGDVVWQVTRRDGPLYLLVVEFQSKPDPWMALRVAYYALHLHLRLIKEWELKRGDELPAVFAIVLYNGEQAYDVATELSELIASVPEELEEFQPSMRYLLIDESRWPREKLLAAGRNAAATFLRLHQSDPQEIQKLVLEESGLDWIDNEDEELMRDLLAWIGLVLLPSRAPETPVPELRTLDELKYYMEKDMETWSEMLLKKGRTEGQIEASQTAILLLARRRFETLPAGFEERIRAIRDLDQLYRILEQVSEVRSLEELVSD